MAATIGENYLDSRDIQDRIEELESLREDYQIENELPEYQNTNEIGIPDGWTEEICEVWDNSDEGEELNLWLKFKDDCDRYGDWDSGIYFIHARIFTEYCKEMRKDVGAIPEDLPSYIENNIDWDSVADDLQVDYTVSEIDDHTYYWR